MSSPAITYARENQKRFLEELKDLLRIPSVSTAQSTKTDIRRAAMFVADDAASASASKTLRSFQPQAIRWFTPIGCMRRASRLRCATRTMTSSRPSRSTNG